METVVQRFKMKHMPNLLNGDYWKEMEYYLDQEPNHGHYRRLLNDFVENSLGEDASFGEAYTILFGIGDNRFSFNEHNLYDFPMSRAKTLYDVVERLTLVQNDLMGLPEGDLPEHLGRSLKYCNLWARHIVDGKYTPIVINSLPMAVNFRVSDAIFDMLEEVSPTELLEEDGEVCIRYSSTEHENVRPYAYEYLNAQLEKIVDHVVDTYAFPRGVLYNAGGEREEDIACYTFTNFHEDAKLVSTERFLEDVSAFNVIGGDVDGMIDELAKGPIDEVRRQFHIDYPDMHEKYKNVSNIRKPRIFVT